MEEKNIKLKNQQKDSGSKDSKDLKDPKTSRPKTDADQAVDRVNKAPNENKNESGDAKKETGFDSPKDDPA